VSSKLLEGIDAIAEDAANAATSVKQLGDQRSQVIIIKANEFEHWASLPVSKMETIDDLLRASVDGGSWLVSPISPVTELLVILAEAGVIEVLDTVGTIHARTPSARRLRVEEVQRILGVTPQADPLVSEPAQTVPVDPVHE
jgi:hypothetical protein